MSDKTISSKKEEDNNIIIEEDPYNGVPNYTNSYLLDENEIDKNKIIRCWSYSSTIRLITSIDIFFCILNGLLYNPWLYITTFIPICGYQGAVQLSTIKTMLYIIYLYLSWFGRVLVIFDLSDKIIQNNSTYTYENNGIDYDSRISISFISISCIVQLLIAIYVSKFICLLYSLTSQEIIVLKSYIREERVNHAVCC